MSVEQNNGVVSVKDILESEVLTLDKLNPALLRKEMIELVKGKGRKNDESAGWVRDKVKGVQSIKNASRRIEVSLRGTFFGDGEFKIIYKGEEIDINGINLSNDVKQKVIEILKAFLQGQIDMIKGGVSETVKGTITGGGIEGKG